MDKARASGHHFARWPDPSPPEILQDISPDTPALICRHHFNDGGLIVAENVTITDIDVIKPGTYTDANGTVVEVTAAMIAEMAAEFEPGLQDAPAVVGHPKMDDPAYGWLRNFRVGEDAVLFCDAVDVDPEFAEILRKGRFKRKSLSFYQPKTRGNPKPGKYYPKHLGLLGARPPAVSGLKPISFAGDDEAVVVELAGPDGWRVSWAFRSIAGALSRFRDYLVQEKGVEEADKILPSYLADDVRNAAAEIDAAERSEAPAPAFSTPEQGGPMATAEELATREAALAARENALQDREKRVQDQEVSLAAADALARKKDDADFVDGLIAEGKLPPGEKDNVLAELAALDDAVTIDLAAGDDGQPARLSLRQAMRRRLSLQPKLVQLGEFDGGDDAVNLASADDIARAATEYRDAEGKAGRHVTAAQAVTHVINKRV